MSVTGTLFDYLSVLAVIQPARIQDIEHYAPQILPHESIATDIKKGEFRKAHETARRLELVVQIKKGTYFLTSHGREAVRQSELYKDIDNARLFLMKDQRKRYR